jgi:hypothetical protein
MDAQEAFAESNKASDVEDGVWCELVKLHAVHKQKPTKKFVGRQRETTKEEGGKNYPPSVAGAWFGFITGKLGLRRRRDKPRLVELAKIVLRALRSAPPDGPRFP